MAIFKDIQDRADRLNEITNAVPIKNRIVDGRVFITYDGARVMWEPGEIKVLPRKVADWLQAKSLYQFNPGNIDEEIPSKAHYKLAILGVGQDESDLTKAEVAGVKELLDRANMPELTRVDPATGKALRVAYIDPKATGAANTLSADRLAKQEIIKRSAKVVELGAEQIAAAAAQTSDSEIEQGVREFAKDAAGPASA